MIPAALITHLQVARHIVVLTGAGVSAESGVPTFRDIQTGLWARCKPEDLATPQVFLRNPKLVWDWYTWRKKLISDVKPNAGHYALVEMENHLTFTNASVDRNQPGEQQPIIREDKVSSDFTLVTQNVDGLHQRAGSQKVLELHGNILRTKCFNEGTLVADEIKTRAVPPRCPYCGGLLRPDVVWYGELLPKNVLDQAVQATQKCDTLFSVGTSALVQPAASLPWWSFEKGQTLLPGTFGENLTISELESASFCVGDRLKVGAVTLEITAPRIPCATLAARMCDLFS